MARSYHFQMNVLGSSTRRAEGSLPGIGSVAGMGMIMKTALVLAIVLIFAGTADAQLSGGSINSSSAINSVASANGSVGINDGGSINSQPGTSRSSVSHVNPDAGVNMNSKNLANSCRQLFRATKTRWQRQSWKPSYGL
jgi:hypothetical protein